MSMSKPQRTIVITILLLIVTVLLWHEKSNYHAHDYNNALTKNYHNQLPEPILKIPQTSISNIGKAPNENEIKHEQFLKHSEEIKREAQQQMQELQRKTKNNPQEMLHQIEAGFM